MSVLVWLVVFALVLPWAMLALLVLTVAVLSAATAVHGPMKVALWLTK